MPSRISVVGLGKLGLCLAAVLASKGFEVCGADLDKSRVDAVNAGVSPLSEPGLQELMSANRQRLSATTSIEEAVSKTEATFIIVPTPSEGAGEFSLLHVAAAVSRVGDALRRKKGYHLVTVTSTVMPGSMEETVGPLLEERSGRRLGEDLGLCYNPELVALGDAIRGMLEPDVVLIGESDAKAGVTLSAIKRMVCNNQPPTAHMNFVNAEIAKIALNSFVTMKMSFANTLAEICESIPGADVDAVTRAIGLDRRIGRSNLKGALGYGGPCFPRDNVAFAQFAARKGVKADLALATHAINVRQVGRVVEMVGSDCGEGARIAVLGLAYKPNTNVLEGSQPMVLVAELAKKGFKVQVYDPAFASGRVLHGLPPNVRLEDSVRACLADAAVCVIATPWPGFSEIPRRYFRGKTVVDCWRILPKDVQDSARYIAIGSFWSQRRRVIKPLKRGPATRRR